MNEIILHECSDWDTIYGVILTEISEAEVCRAIRTIKKDLEDLGIYDWTIEDVLNEFDFDFEFVKDWHVDI